MAKEGWRSGVVKPETEELLYFLLWTMDAGFTLSWRNLNSSFEGWAWRNQLGRRLAELRRQKLLEMRPGPNLDRILRLTREGRRAAWGGREPDAQWGRPWDGRWRLILFDIPVVKGRLRQRFRRVLRRLGYGCLQGSVWVSPDPAENLRKALGETVVHADALLIMEGSPVAGERDHDIVAGAWDLPLLQRRYERYLDFLDQPLPAGSRVAAWSARETVVWRNAVQVDPFLPQALLPGGYLGRVAYERRQQTFLRLATKSGWPRAATTFP